MTNATFSNGYTRTYKGNRPVRAAWMITDKATGKVLMSGFSLTSEKARKTAISNIRMLTLEDTQYDIPFSPGVMPEQMARELLNQLKANGDWTEGTKATRATIWNAARAANAKVNSNKRDQVAIEVTGLD